MMATRMNCLCRKARDLPNEVKDAIGHYSPPVHPLAQLVKGLEFHTQDPKHFADPITFIKCPAGSVWKPKEREMRRRKRANKRGGIQLPVDTDLTTWRLDMHSWISWRWGEWENEWPLWVLKELAPERLWLFYAERGMEPDL
jgi:hypothetical protein